MKKKHYIATAVAVAVMSCLPFAFQGQPKQQFIKAFGDPLPTTGEAQNVIDLRAAVAAGGVVNVQPGTYVFMDTLVLTGVTSLRSTSSLDFCVFDFRSMVDPTKEAMRIDKNWDYEISNITIRGNRATNAIGILNSSATPTAYGTVSGFGIFSHVFIYGFQKGLVVGDGNRYIAASENIYQGLKITQCDRCIELNDYNTLNHLFIMLQMGDCGEGMVAQGAGYITVQSGSFSSVKGCLFKMDHCSASRIRDCRMENGNVFFLGGTTGTGEGHDVSGCLAHQDPQLSTYDTSAYANGWQSPFIVGGAARLVVRNCTVIQSSAPNWPTILDVHNCPGGYIEAVGNSSTVDPSKTPFISPNASTTLRRLSQFNMWTESGQVFKGWYADQNQ